MERTVSSDSALLAKSMEMADSSDSALLALDAALMCGVDEATAAEGAAVSDLLEMCADGPVGAKKKRGRPPKVKREVEGEMTSLLEQASASPVPINMPTATVSSPDGSSGAAAPAAAVSPAHATSAQGKVVGGTADQGSDRRMTDE